MAENVRIAVIPVAGESTRMLPATRAVPKELLNVVDWPVIEYVVDEAIDAGIEHIVFVTGCGKSAIEDYFDRRAVSCMHGLPLGQIDNGSRHGIAFVEVA